MYNLYAPLWDTSKTLRKLLKEVLGYSDNEIDILESEHFDRNIAIDLTIEQAKDISQIFGENDFQIYLNIDRGEYNEILFWKPDLNISIQHNIPKSHYCDEPLISRDHLADLSVSKKMDKPLIDNHQLPKSKPVEQPVINTNNAKPAVECPYCHSTNTKKISGMSKAGAVALFGIFALGKTSKQWHCNGCGSDF